MHTNRTIPFVLVLLLIAAGCSRPVLDDITNPLQRKLDGITGSAAQSFVSSAGLTLNSDPTRANIDSALDVFTTRVRRNLIGEETRKEIDSIGLALKLRLLETEVGLLERLEASADSITGAPTRRRLAALREELLGQRSRVLLGDLREELLGEETDRLLLRIARDLREELAGDSIRVELGEIRDELLGARTRSFVDSIVVSALGYADTVATRQQGFLKRNTTEVLWVAGIIIAGLLILAGYIFFKKRKQEKMLDVVTTQIHQMGDADAKAELARQIKENSLRNGVESDLKQFLARKGTRVSPAPSKG